MRVDRHDDALAAGLGAARTAGATAILRVQDSAERTLTVQGGVLVRVGGRRLAGLGLHAWAADGSIGFASTDDLTPAAAATAVRRATALAEATRRYDGRRRLAPLPLLNQGRRRLPGTYADVMALPVERIVAVLGACQRELEASANAVGLTVRTTLRVTDDEWRIARSDGTDVSFALPRAILRHDLTVRVGGTTVRAGAAVTGPDAQAVTSAASLGLLERRARLAFARATATATAPPAAPGPALLVLDHALAKGLAHEAVGHLCESDVDGSVLMRGGRLRLGDRLADPSISIVDGPLPGDYAWQPISANGIHRQTVALVEDGILAGGLGDLFSAGQAGIPITGACRAATFRDRPTPRMTNIRIVDANPAPLDADPESLTPDDVLAAVRRAGVLERGTSALYLSGYGGGQAQPRRGDFVFGVAGIYDLTDGAAPRRPGSFAGLAERALAAIRRGIGPLMTDAVGRCSKDGSAVTSSGGSHALLVLAPDPTLTVSAAP